MPERSKKSLGETLQDRGLVSQEQLAIALDQQQKNGGKIGFILVRQGALPLPKLISLLEEFPGIWGYEYDPTAKKKAAQAITRKLALYYRIAPIKLQNDVLTIGISNLENVTFFQSLSEITGYRIDPLIFPESEIRALLTEAYPVPGSDPGLEISSFTENVFSVIDGAKRIQALTRAQLKKDTSAAELLRSIIAEAIKEKSREILIRPEAGNSLVFFRTETSNSFDFLITPEKHDDLSFLIFHLAKMDPFVSQRLQTGRFRVKIHDRRILMVITAEPGMLGYRFLMEMFDEKLLKHSNEQILKPLPDLKKQLDDLFSFQKKGMLIITGPEGSGRTSFLYGLLTQYKENFRQVLTLENRIRYPLTGITQREVSREEIPGALNEIRLLKPDLLAIHTLQDARAADSAFLSAARFPVIAVMSSFDSFLAIEWLVAHGFKSAMKAGLVHTIISLRLIPRICPNCSVPFEINRNAGANIEIPAGLHLKMNQGCDVCRLKDHENAELFIEYIRINSEVIDWLEGTHNAFSVRQKFRKAGKSTLFDTVIRDAFTEHLDMLSVMKLHSAIVEPV